MGLTAILNANTTDTVIYADSVSRLQEMLVTHPRAMVILDYTLFDFKSTDQMLNLRNFAQESNWLLFSDELSPQFIRQVLVNTPELGIVMKNDSQQDIETAIETVAKGGTYVCEPARQLLRDKNEDLRVELTATEKLVLHEIALGKTTKEIAFEKNLSFHTVNTHRKNIFRKLEINNVHEAIRYAIRAGIFDVAEYYL
jgi:DNA-binding NarL/FixJ family response regulator